MLRTRKRITRKEIRKPDRFFNITGWIVRFINRNRLRIITFAVLLVVAVASAWGWQFYQSKLELKAAQDYSAAVEAYRKGQYERSLNLLGSVNAPTGSIYHHLTLLYQAYNENALKRPSQAIPLLTKLLAQQPKGTYLQQIAYLALGYTQEAMGNCKSAILNFDHAARIPSSLKEDGLLGKARCNIQIGNLTTGLGYYREYLTNYPGSASELALGIRIQKLESKAGINP